jgi:predicted small metal-binding protein
MKLFSCATLGIDCKTVLTAPTEERLVEMASMHARDTHGMTAISQEIVGKIKQSLTNRSASDAAYAVDRIFEKYNCENEPECSWRFIAEAEQILTGDKAAHARELRAA